MYSENYLQCKYIDSVLSLAAAGVDILVNVDSVLSLTAAGVDVLVNVDSVLSSTAAGVDDLVNVDSVLSSTAAGVDVLDAAHHPDGCGHQGPAAAMEGTQ